MLQRDTMTMATHININKYKGKYFTEVSLQFQSLSSLSSVRNMMPCRHTWCWRAESSTSQSTGSRRRDCVLDIVWAYEIQKPTPHSDLLQQGHTPIVSLTMNQAFKQISLWVHTCSNNHTPLSSPQSLVINIFLSASMKSTVFQVYRVEILQFLSFCAYLMPLKVHKREDIILFS